MEKYDYRFPRLSPYHRFCYIFLYCGKFMGNPIYFPYAGVYHRMGIRSEKIIHTMGKVWLSISQTFPIPRVLLHFPKLWEIYGETHALSIGWHRLIFPCDYKLLFSKKMYTLVHQNKYMETKFTYHEEYLFCLFFSRKGKKIHTDQSIVQPILLCPKRNVSQTFKSSSCKKVFPKYVYHL